MAAKAERSELEQRRLHGECESLRQQVDELTEANKKLQNRAVEAATAAAVAAAANNNNGGAHGRSPFRKRKSFHRVFVVVAWFFLNYFRGFVVLLSCRFLRSIFGFSGVF